MKPTAHNYISLALSLGLCLPFNLTAQARGGGGHRGGGEVRQQAENRGQERQERESQQRQERQERQNQQREERQARQSQERQQRQAQRHEEHGRGGGRGGDGQQRAYGGGRGSNSQGRWNSQTSNSNNGVQNYNWGGDSKGTLASTTSANRQFGVGGGSGNSSSTSSTSSTSSSTNNSNKSASYKSNYSNNRSTFAEDHPRRAETLGRDSSINKELQTDKSKLGAQYGQLQHEDNAIKNQEQRDAHQNGGYITKGEQKQLNREENHLQSQINHDMSGGHVWKGSNNSKSSSTSNTGKSTGSSKSGFSSRDKNSTNTSKFAEDHPRRSETLGRDKSIDKELQSDKGQLNGHYGQLQHEANAIKNQEQRDARRHDGHLTKREQDQINREENHLQSQINHDKSSGQSSKGSTTGKSSSTTNNGKSNGGKGNTGKSSGGTSNSTSKSGANSSNSNTNNKSQFAEDHPRRSETLGRDKSIDKELQSDKGQLNGHYGQLQHEANAIKNQEQRDARRHDGHLTKREQDQINREENHLQSQINHDKASGQSSKGSTTGKSSSTSNSGKASSATSGGTSNSTSKSGSNSSNNNSTSKAGSNSSNNSSNKSQFAQDHPRRAETLGRDKSIDKELQADKGRLGGHEKQLDREARRIREQEQRDARRHNGHLTKREQDQINKEENHLQSQINHDMFGGNSSKGVNGGQGSSNKSGSSNNGSSSTTNSSGASGINNQISPGSASSN